MAGADAALVVSGVSKSFAAGKRRVQALDGVDLRLTPGRVTGLIGPDGAGKTTLMRLCACLLAPDAGTITVLGMDAVRTPLAVQSAVGYMPQRFGLYEDLSVQENLDLYADLQGVTKADRPARWAELMRMTNLGPFTDRLSGRLSGGMKQKLGLACTLVRAPRLLILDEPTVGVDPVSRRELWSIVSRLVAETGMTVLLSTAYLDEAERCDAVIMLHHGKVLGAGSPADFSREQSGRSFYVIAEGLARREVQMRLSREPWAADAVIQGDGVRLLSLSDSRPPVEAALGDARQISLTPVPPRFEDSYVARLRQTSAGKEAASAASQSPPRADAQTREPVIRVANLQRRFGDFLAVDKVTFSVDKGEIFGLLGANGAGKTTTFRMLCGLLPASGGELSVAGLDLRRTTAKARGRIGYMSQKFSLYGQLSVWQNLDFFSSAYNLRGKHRKERIAWALAEFDLAHLSEINGADLPLGYKQRLALACALMHDPEILFLDEPTSGVDPMARREFWGHINALAHSGVTVLVTTHFMEEAEYCDRLVIMAAGEVLALGTPSEIRLQAGAETMEAAFIALIEGRKAAA